MKKLTTTKIFLYLLFINCILIELVAVVLWIKTDMKFDLFNNIVRPLITQLLGFAIYSYKSMRENTEGGITYMTALESEDKNGK